jgi:hypothetical protein
MSGGSFDRFVTVVNRVTKFTFWRLDGAARRGKQTVDAVREGANRGALTMMKSVRVGVAALAFAGLAAQPIAANAGEWWCHKNVSYGPAYAVAWGIGFFLCDGMITGKQEKQAKAHHTTVSGHDRVAGILACIIPPLGLASLEHHHG